MAAWSSSTCSSRPRIFRWKASPSQSAGSRGSKYGTARLVAQAGEAADQRAPHPAGGGDVDAVDRVAVGVVQVDEQGMGEVVQRGLPVAHLGRHDALDAGGQGGVAGGDGVVEVEGAALFLGGEILPLQEHGQHRVRLLQDLVPVDHERVEVQQQRVLGPGRGPVPRLQRHEVVVLGMHLEVLVVGQLHPVARPAPRARVRRRRSPRGPAPPRRAG